MGILLPMRGISIPGRYADRAEGDSVLPIPARATKSEREAMLSGERRPTVKPDYDNIAKLVSDALNGIAFDDDRCIVDAMQRKFYLTDPRTVVIIREAGKGSEERGK